MKKIITCIAIAVTAIIGNHANAKCLSELGIANHLGVDLGVGTTGISFEASTPITRFVQARVGVSYMPAIKFNVDTDVDLGTPLASQLGYSGYRTEMELQGSLGRWQGSLIFNVYPLGNRFPLFVAVGGYFGGRDLVKIEGYCPEAAGLLNSSVEIGDYNLPLDATGHARGSLRVNAFRPYIGIGTGRPCPNKRINFMWELGVQIQGKPYVWDEVNKTKVDLDPVLDSDDTFQKIMDKLKVYPVLKFTISGRIF